MASVAMRNLVWLLGYLVLMALLVVVFVEARRRTIATLDNPQARAQWQAWRKEAQRQSQGVGPVRRRPPKGDEPPALVMMRDHFAAALGSALAIASCLYLFLVIVARGAIRSASPSRPID